MISLNKALEIAAGEIQIQGTEKVDFRESLGRILAENIYSDTDLPPFNKSAMDGYACRKEDLFNKLEVLEIIPAGQSPSKIIGENQCSKIMTGAEVPLGADTVFMVEFAEETSQGKIKFNGTKTSSNICLRGEDLQEGTMVLSEGTELQPQHIAILASVGCTFPLVYKVPEIGIISTGSELIEPGQEAEKAKIRNSNGHQIVAQVLKASLKANYYGIVNDDKDKTLKIIKKSTGNNNVTIISGGVSVGDFDYVPWAIEQCGFSILFNKLSVKPGKHTTFAVSSDRKKYIIGLPGNPVSSFIQFEVFAKPFIQKLMGLKVQEVRIPLQFEGTFTRRKTDREEFLPIILNKNNKAEMVKYNGSAHIHAYHNAFGVVLIEKGKSDFKEGEIVYVRQL